MNHILEETTSFNPFPASSMFENERCEIDYFKIDVFILGCRCHSQPFFIVQREIKEIVSFLLLESNEDEYFDADPTYYNVEVNYECVDYPVWFTISFYHYDHSIYNHHFYHVYDVQTSVITERVMRE